MSNLEKKFKNYVLSNTEFKPSKLKEHFVKELSKISEASAVLYKAKKKAFPLRPSAALSCGRALYFDLKDFFNPEEVSSPPLSLRQHRVFQYGHFIENFEVNQVNQVHGLQVTHQQFPVLVGQIHGFTIKGSIDGIIWDLKKRIPYLTDVKSINTYGYKDVEKSYIPRMSNYAQLNLYLCSPSYNELMDNLGIPENRRLGILFYSNKDNQEFEWIEVKPDRALFDATMKRFERIYEAYKENKIPPRDYVSTYKFPCGVYCPHSVKCMGAGSGYADPDLNLEVKIDLNLDADPHDLIYTLWQQVGTSSTYSYKDKLLTVVRGEDAWELNVRSRDNVDGVGYEIKGTQKRRKAVPRKKASRKRSRSV